ncbi:hypothetical protein Pan241w_26240 [Gimesia alba]|uniref:Uncharacterized protein n=1 Tax=Gimesia alba TaxID=2527973 RepID=A0A517RF85_9PLAN|nr:hypothetical protein [Gimesia alba]QDT42539.1 hypothetical protein Pan241w_26240 [Gimesia alba]
MHAYLSARLSLAVIVEDQDWHLLLYDDLDKLHSTSAEEVAVLFRQTSDVQELPNTTIEHVRDRLEDAVDSIEAFDLVLLLLDDKLTKNTQRLVALELEELLVYPEIVESIENVLFASPLPISSVRQETLAMVSEISCVAVSNFLQRLIQMQPIIKVVCNAWNEMASNRFTSKDKRKWICGLYVRHGLFRRMVYEVKKTGTVAPFDKQVMLEPSISKSIPSFKDIWNEVAIYLHEPNIHPSHKRARYKQFTSKKSVSLLLSLTLLISFLGWLFYFYIPESTFADTDKGQERILVYRDGRVKNLPEGPSQVREKAKSILRTKNIEIASVLSPLKLRGTSERGVLLYPLATAIINPQPEFSWKRIPGAMSYRVELFASGSDLDLNLGGETYSTTWTPNAELKRGTTYLWRVIAVTKSGELVSPPWNAPAGGFFLLDAKSVEKLTEMEQSLGSSRILKVALYSQFGMLADAEKLLEELLEANPKESLLEELYQNLVSKRSALR